MEGPIRYLMFPMLLAMWGGIFWAWSSGLMTASLISGLVISHLVCTIIFVNFTSVFNYGYSAVMAVVPVVYAAYYSPSLAASVFLAISVLYGARLASFTWRRNRSESFTGRRKRSARGPATLPFPVVVIIWLFLSSLTFFITFNAWVVAASSRTSTTIWLAIIVMLFGLAIESIADRQKQDVKRVDKDACCYIGLYKRMRHPNYLGEIIFHVGLFWGMLTATDQRQLVILASLGTGWVIAMMCSEAFYLDRNQQEYYGGSEKFDTYRRNSGLLLPKLF